MDADHDNAAHAVTGGYFDELGDLVDDDAVAALLDRRPAYSRSANFPPAHLDASELHSAQWTSCPSLLARPSCVRTHGRSP